MSNKKYDLIQEIARDCSSELECRRVKLGKTYTMQDLSNCVYNTYNAPGHNFIPVWRCYVKEKKTGICTIMKLDKIEYDNHFLQTNSLEELVHIYKTGGMCDIDKALAGLNYVSNLAEADIPS